MIIGSGEAWALAWDALARGKHANVRIEWGYGPRPIAPFRDVQIVTPNLYSLHDDLPFSMRHKLAVMDRA